MEIRTDTRFWIATAGRGVLALVFGCAIMLLSDFAATLILLPFAVAFSVLCLAIYGLLDSFIILGSSFSSCSPLAKMILRVQGIVGIIVAAGILLAVFDKVRLGWFFYLIVIQVLCTSISELIVARHTFTRSESRWDYAASAVAAVCAIFYFMVGIFLGGKLVVREIEWMIFGYLLAFGVALVGTATRMLYTDYKLAGGLHASPAKVQ